MAILGSIQRFIVAMTALVCLTWLSLFSYDSLVATQGGLGLSYRDLIEVAILISAGLIFSIMARRFRNTVANYLGRRAASILTFFMIIFAAVSVFLGILNIFQVPTNTILLGGGIFSVVIGLAVSTLFGNVIAGALVVTTFPFAVGDGVLLNNVPGRIMEISALYTKIANDSGSETVIPNSAIIQGSVSLSKLHGEGVAPENRLHYQVGDRVYTSYVGGEGIVTEITPFYTRVMLEPDREATIPNVSILNGSVQIAKITSPPPDVLSLSLEVTWDAEATISAMSAAAADKGIFKSAPEISYESIDGESVKLGVTVRVDPKMKNEARNHLLRAAYLARRQSSAA